MRRLELEFQGKGLQKGPSKHMTEEGAWPLSPYSVGLDVRERKVESKGITPYAGAMVASHELSAVTRRRTTRREGRRARGIGESDDFGRDSRFR